MQDLSDGHDLIREDGKGERAGFLGFVESATLSMLKGSSEGNSPVLSLYSSLWSGTYPRSHNWSAPGLARALAVSFLAVKLSSVFRASFKYDSASFTCFITGLLTGQRQLTTKRAQRLSGNLEETVTFLCHPTRKLLSPKVSQPDVLG